ncbi:MAG: hydrolase [Alphaproteobacteria bacterium 32-64-14]|nr:MAG: hydrolase [Alphaproteobacteria bacterium 32-64-14]
MSRRPTERSRNTPHGSPRAWQRMLSGRRLDLLDPSPLDIEIEDIAHGLARVARWNGQTRGDHAFSVAQHSVLVASFTAQIAPDATAADLLGALLHDAPEYVIGDMISPFKTVLGGDYKKVELRLEGAIRLRFGLSPHMTGDLKARVKQADQIAAFYEATRLAGFDVDEALEFFGSPPPGAAPDMTPLATADAQALFLRRFAELQAEMDGA